MRLLLDTHIWLWSMLDPGQLSRRTIDVLRSGDSQLWLSSISLWELMVLVEKGRLRLEIDVDAWIDQSLRLAPLREAPLSHAIVRSLGRIETPHSDPADRFIAATAAALDLHLLTADEKLLGGDGYRTFPN